MIRGNNGVSGSAPGNSSPVARSLRDSDDTKIRSESQVMRSDSSPGRLWQVLKRISWKCPWQTGPQSQGWPFGFFPFPVSIRRHTFSPRMSYSFALRLPHPLPTPLFSPPHLLSKTDPVYWAGRQFGHLHRWIALLRLSWKLGYILDLGEFRGKKWPHWGFLSIKWNTHKSMLLLSFQERAVSTQGLSLKTGSI